MPLLPFFAFFFLGASFLSLWIRRDPKIWGSLLALSMLCGLTAGNIHKARSGLILGFSQFSDAFEPIFDGKLIMDTARPHS